MNARLAKRAGDKMELAMRARLEATHAGYRVATQEEDTKKGTDLFVCGYVPVDITLNESKEGITQKSQDMLVFDTCYVFLYLRYGNEYHKNRRTKGWRDDIAFKMPVVVMHVMPKGRTQEYHEYLAIAEDLTENNICALLKGYWHKHKNGGN